MASMHNPRRRGLSLIEALVAMAVMGLGMLAVLGMQSTLRYNGDQARQRTEALRLAQDAVEEWRAFSVLDTTANRIAYADLVSRDDADIVGANATYRRRRVVSTEAAVAGTDMPRRRLLVVEVRWTDRSNQEQLVRLNTVIAGSAPELAGTVAVAGITSPVVRPRGRHPGIPPEAKDLGPRSVWLPPQNLGGDNVVWRFDNVTGLITICTSAITSTELLEDNNITCAADEVAQLVSGFVRYATLDRQVEAADLVDPRGPDFPDFRLRVDHTAPVVGSSRCFRQYSTTFVQFFCAVPVQPLNKAWTGALNFRDLPLLISSSLADFSVDRYKICRYHANADYTAIDKPLTNQNFVIIRAGVGTDPPGPFNCPTVGTPQVWPHQPNT